MHKIAIAAAALAAMMSVTVANAASYTFSFSGSGYTGSGTLTTSDTVTAGYDQQDGYEITSFTGMVNGVTIGDLLAVGTDVGGAPVTNLLYPSVPELFDFQGFGFYLNGAKASIYNYIDPSYFEIFIEGQGNKPISFNLTAVAAVPEPSTWAMMMLGLAGLGFAGRRRQCGTAAHNPRLA
jgi:hypothetical protein